VRKVSGRWLWGSLWLWGGKPVDFRMEGYRVSEFGKPVDWKRKVSPCGFWEKPIALCGEQVGLKGVVRQDLCRWEL